MHNILMTFMEFAFNQLFVYHYGNERDAIVFEEAKSISSHIQTITQYKKHDKQTKKYIKRKK